MRVSTASGVEKVVRGSYPHTISKKRLIGEGGEKTNLYGLFRSDGVHVGKAVSQHYTPHTIDDVAAFCEASVSGFPDMELDVQCTWNNGHKVIIGPTKEWRREACKGDVLFPRFVLSAGYLNESFWASLAAERDLCSNLMMLSRKGEVTRSLRHVKNLRDNMPTLIATFHELSQSWDDLAAAAKAMQEREVSFKEYIRSVYPMPEKEAMTIPLMESYIRRIEMIGKRISLEHQALSRKPLDMDHITAWQAFNGVQGFVQHVVTRRGANETDRALSALKDATVKRAFDLAISA